MSDIYDKEAERIYRNAGMAWPRAIAEIMRRTVHLAVTEIREGARTAEVVEVMAGRPAPYTDAEIERMASKWMEGDGFFDWKLCGDAPRASRMTSARAVLCGDMSAANDDFIKCVLSEKAKIDAEKARGDAGQTAELVCGACGSEYAMLTNERLRVVHKRGCLKAPAVEPAPASTGRVRDLPSTTRYYSGDASTEFWRRVNAHAEPRREMLYFAGVLLQEMEARVLHQLDCDDNGQLIVANPPPPPTGEGEGVRATCVHPPSKVRFNSDREWECECGAFPCEIPAAPAPAVEPNGEVAALLLLECDAVMRHFAGNHGAIAYRFARNMAAGITRLAADRERLARASNAFQKTHALDAETIDTLLARVTELTDQVRQQNADIAGEKAAWQRVYDLDVGRLKSDRDAAMQSAREAQELADRALASGEKARARVTSLEAALAASEDRGREARVQDVRQVLAAIDALKWSGSVTGPLVSRKEVKDALRAIIPSPPAGGEA